MADVYEDALWVLNFADFQIDPSEVIRFTSYCTPKVHSQPSQKERPKFCCSAESILHK